MEAEISVRLFRRGGRGGSFPGRRNHCQSKEEERLQLLPETERNAIWLERGVFGVDKQQQRQMMKAELSARAKSESSFKSSEFGGL